MELSRKTVWLREWIIFALSIGLGGHVALGLILHDPSSELWRNIGWNAFFIGLFIYAAIQACRSIFVAIRARRMKRDVTASRPS
jgi:hypothetical protein